MLNYNHLPKTQKGNIDYFPGVSNSDGVTWIAWQKPRGIHMIRITCIAGGGGGGSGYSNNTTTSRGGGGGGGSSAVSTVNIPAYVLPDVLYISSGVGGAGAPAGGAALGSNGIRSYVCIAQDASVIYRVCYADSGKAGTTLPTSTSVGGGAGAGGTVATITDMPLASYGSCNFIAGQIGGTGGTTGVGSSVTYPATGLLLSGGSGGGGGASGLGGTITAPTQTIYNIFSSILGGQSAGLGGNLGREIYQPLLSTGSGGGASASGTGAGGNGAAGGFGSGGSGGGAGGASAAGGGGKGGNGLVIIHSW